jgi:hypothetical protein
LKNKPEEYIIDFYAKVCATVKGKKVPKNMTEGISRLLHYQYFETTYHVYSPEKHYDTFIGMYRDGNFDSGNIYRVFFDREPITIDKRWVKDFIQKEDVELLCPVMEDGDKEAVKCLVEHLEKGIKAKKLRPGSVMCTEKLIGIDYKGLDKLLFSIIESCGRNWQYNSIFVLAGENAGKIFSKDYIKKFEVIQEKMKSSGPFYSNFIVDKLKNYYGEKTDGT